MTPDAHEIVPQDFEIPYTIERWKLMTGLGVVVLALVLILSLIYVVGSRTEAGNGDVSPIPVLKTQQSGVDGDARPVEEGKPVDYRGVPAATPRSAPSTPPQPGGPNDI